MTKQACENQPSEHKNADLFIFALSQLNTCLDYHNKIFINTAEFMGFLRQLTEMGYCVLNGGYKQQYNLM